MSILRNSLHEAAAQHLAAAKAEEGRSLIDEAAIIGGLDPEGSSFKPNARKFCNRKDIKRRVAEIQLAGAILAETSVASLIVETDDARLKAMREKGGASAAVQAIICKAKLAGLWIEKSAFTGKDGAPLIPEYTDEQRVIALTALLTKTTLRVPA
jgi:hypothetical protein